MVCKLGREKPRQCCCRWPSRGTAPSKNSSLRRRAFTQGKHGSHDEQSDMSSSGTTTIGCRYFYYLLLLAYSFFTFIRNYHDCFNLCLPFFFWLWSSVTSIYCWFHVGKLKPCQGWGFIIQEDGGPNLFFHSNAIESGHYWCLVGNEGMGWLFIDHSPISLHHLMGYIMRYPGFYCWRQFWM